MKSMFKISVFATIILCSTAVWSQTDNTANQVMQKVNEALSQSDCDRAQRNYNVWKELTKQTSSTVERKIQECRQGTKPTNWICGDNVQATLNGSTLTISGTGAMDDYSNSAPWNSSSDLIKTIEIKQGVTTIGDGAFHGCKNLTNITIPNSVVKIGHSAFAGCKSITSITIPNSVSNIGNSAFADCESLGSFTIPDAVTSIASKTFAGCKSITSITIPNSVSNIGNGTFWDCESLASITIPKNAKITDNPFTHCTSLQYINVDAANSEYSFVNGMLCDKSQKMLLVCPAGKTGNIFIPSNITRIQEYAFHGCENLTSITIHKNVSSIGSNPFLGCYSLRIINVDADNPHFCSVNGILYNINADLKKFGIYMISLIACPAGQTGSISLPNNIMGISNRAFYSCKKITSVTIPECPTYIGDFAFGKCENLVSIVLPNSLSKSALGGLGFAMFAGCKNLTSITNLCQKPESVDTRTILQEFDYRNCILYVPRESVEAYRNTEGWKEFNRIEAIR